MWGVGAWGVGDEGLVIGRVSCVGLGVCYYGDASFLSVSSLFSFFTVNQKISLRVRTGPLPSPPLRDSLHSDANVLKVM